MTHEDAIRLINILNGIAEILACLVVVQVFRLFAGK